MRYCTVPIAVLAAETMTTVSGFILKRCVGLLPLRAVARFFSGGTGWCAEGCGMNEALHLK